MDIINKTSIPTPSVTHAHKGITYICTSLRTHPHPQLTFSNHSWMKSDLVKFHQKDCPWIKSHVYKKQIWRVHNDDNIWLSRFTSANNMINWIPSPNVWLSESCTEEQLIDWSPCLWEITPINFFKDKGLNVYSVNLRAAANALHFTRPYVQLKEKLFPS